MTKNYLSIDGAEANIVPKIKLLNYITLMFCDNSICTAMVQHLLRCGAHALI
jgi:hypothetical protein